MDQRIICFMVDPDSECYRSPRMEAAVPLAHCKVEAKFHRLSFHKFCYLFKLANETHSITVLTNLHWAELQLGSKEIYIQPLA